MATILTELEILEREVVGAYAKVNNGIHNRQVHPTYGYTKTSLRHDLAILEGLLIAHRIVTGRAPANPTALIHEYAESVFGIDLNRIATRISEA